MIPGLNIISGKASVASVNRAGGSAGALSPTTGDLGTKQNLDWFKLDLNVAEIITV